jgi:hypothetical protein
MINPQMIINRTNCQQTRLALRIAGLLLIATILLFPSPDGWLWYASLTVFLPGALLWSSAYRGVLYAWAKVCTWLSGPTLSELWARVTAFLAVLAAAALPPLLPRRRRHQDEDNTHFSPILGSSLSLRAPPLPLSL